MQCIVARDPFPNNIYGRTTWLSRTNNTAVLVPLPKIMGGSSSASASASWELITRDRNTFKQ